MVCLSVCLSLVVPPSLSTTAVASARASEPKPRTRDDYDAFRSEGPLPTPDAGGSVAGAASATAPPAPTRPRFGSPSFPSPSRAGLSPRLRVVVVPAAWGLLVLPSAPALFPAWAEAAK